MVSEIWLDLVSLLWPCACLLCGVPARELCKSCVAKVGHTSGSEGSLARAVLVRTPAGPEVWACGSYEGSLRSLLIACKHRGRPQVVRVLGGLLSVPLRHGIAARDGPFPPLLVAVPSRQEKTRERGFRHVDLMVRRALEVLRQSHGTQAYFVAGALRALPGRTGQVGLTSVQRAQNAQLVSVSTRVRSRLRGREVVLVDDIATTGATLQAASRALAAVDARVIGLVVLGCTTRKTEKNFDAQPTSLQTEVEVTP